MIAHLILAALAASPAPPPKPAAKSKVERAKPQPSAPVKADAPTSEPALKLEPVGNTAPPKVAIPGLSGVNVAPEMLGFYGEHLAQKLNRAGLRVVTSKEIAAVLGFERQRQLTACTNEECAVDLAGALGADALLMGEVARIGNLLQFHFKVVDARDAKRLASFSAEVEGEDVILETLNQSAVLLANDTARSLGRPLPQGAASLPIGKIESGVRRFAWIPAASGAAVAVVGGVFLSFARDNHLALTANSGQAFLGAEADALRAEGKRNQTVGWAGLGLGLLGLGSGAVMYFLGGGTSRLETSMGVVPGIDGWVLSGQLP
jgi:hypothetical protein